MGGGWGVGMGGGEWGWGLGSGEGVGRRGMIAEHGTASWTRSITSHAHVR